MGYENGRLLPWRGLLIDRPHEQFTRANIIELKEILNRGGAAQRGWPVPLVCVATCCKCQIRLNPTLSGLGAFRMLLRPALELVQRDQRRRRCESRLHRLGEREERA